jgi:hypothetical protein
MRSVVYAVSDRLTICSLVCELVDAAVWPQGVWYFAFYSLTSRHKTSGSTAVRWLG